MQRNILKIALVVLLISTCGALFAQKGREAHTVTICATTDIHGKYFDSLYVDNQANKTSLSNVSTYIKGLRREGVHPVLIDVGDNLQGDNASYFFNFEHTQGSHLYTQIASYMGYDAVVVGNHDIEPGHKVYDKLNAESGVPYLAANAIITEGESAGKPYFKEYTVVERDGIKIAIIGLTNGCIKNWLTPELWSGMKFVTPASVAQRVVDSVRAKESPDIVVLAMHSGTGDGSPSNHENQGKYVASFIKGVDLILCGHDHRAYAGYVENPEGNVLLLNAGTRCSVLAQCIFSVEKEGGKLLSKSAAYRLVPMADVPTDEDYNNRFETEFEMVREFTNKPIGVLLEDIHTSDALYGPSAYLSLIHKVQLMSTDADISIAAPLQTGSVIKKGVLNFQDLFSIYQFENQLFVVEMKGSQLKSYLEMSYDTWINNTAPSFNFDSAEGILYTVDKKKKKGERVIITSMSNGTPFDSEKIYKVAMTSYRASGAGGLLQFGAGINPQTDDSFIVGRYPEIRDLIREYIVKEKEIVPISSNNWRFIE